MTLFNALSLTAAALIILKWAAQIWLERLNLSHVRTYGGAVPEAFKGAVDETTYRKSVEYTLAKGKFDQIETSYQVAILLLILFSGMLPWAFNLFTRWLGTSAWAMAVLLFAIGLALSLPSLPLAWYDQFKLEERFGFNTSTQKIWWLDRLKGLLLGIILGYPLLVLVLKFVDWTGPLWWLWAWAALLAFQMIMAVLAPVLILPLFNKFTALPESSLRDRLLKLAQRTRFRARSIQVIDGRKPSRHSNAFFTGFGQFRKIILFDTLIQQLLEPELEAVLAHEIGHYRRKHIPKMLVFSALGSLLGFYILSVLAREPWFYRAFGFEPGNVAPAFLLFGLLAGVITFWFSPIMHWWSRRYEYQADSYAAAAMGEPQSLMSALRKLT